MANVPAKSGIGTQCVHAGVEPDPIHGAVNPAIQLSTTFVQPEPAKPLTYDYSRAGNPTRAALETAIATLERGATGHAFASGLAATDAMLSLLNQGDHVVCAEDAYGGTIRMLRQVSARRGIETTFVDTQDLDAVQESMRPETGLVLMETPTNPLLRVSDISGVARIAHDADALLAVDNTFMSPSQQRPLDHGADLVLHSATKFIGGHSDVLGGLVVAKNEDVGERITFLQLAVGGVAQPFDCYMMLRGIKTLHLRTRAQSETAMCLATRLREAGLRVLYPGLVDHPGHELHARQATAGGSMLSFYAGSPDAAVRCAKATRIWQLAESLGAVESLVQIPALMTHASVPAEMRAATGLSDDLVRLSVGVEDEDDLWNDLEGALNA